MSDTILEAFRSAHNALSAQFREHIEVVQTLQRRLRDDILPGVLDDLRIPEDMLEGEMAKAREWIDDTASIFRMLKRHKFTSSFALEAMRDTLIWRLRSFRQDLPESVRHCRIFHALPDQCQDPIGRPIIFCSAAKLGALAVSAEDLRQGVVHLMETFRMLLRERSGAACVSLEATGPERDIPVLQYTLVLDVKDVSVRTKNIDLLRWYMSEVQPRFPGVVGSVMVVNYSWTHSGLWNVARRMLPKSTLNKIFFLNEEDLAQLLTPSCLPEDYGGSLPPLSTSPDGLQKYLPPAANLLPSPFLPMEDSPPTVPDTSLPVTRVPSLLPTSLLNPFFGYPVSSSSQSTSQGVPGLKHGRRRKRDLIRTLIALWWEKWKHQLGWVGFTACLWLLWKVRLRARSLLRP